MRPSTSIYRQGTGLVYAVADPLDRIQRDGAEPQVPVDFARQRRALPIVVLLPNTQKWFDALPHEIQPRALCKLYPRVANLIAAMWTDREALSAYLNELFVDRRRCRKGFPRDVLHDLRVLRHYSPVLSPNTISAPDRKHRNV
jgi:hypothetical protein